MFKLYRVEKSVFTFDDYGALLKEAERIGARKVLEFGPGNSTLAWVEEGCTEITTLEHQRQWLQVARQKLGHYRNVNIMAYQNKPVIEIPELNGKHFDLIFVDSPVGIEAIIISR